jgi:hypothetical protein
MQQAIFPRIDSRQGIPWGRLTIKVSRLLHDSDPRLADSLTSRGPPSPTVPSGVNIRVGLYFCATYTSLTDRMRMSVNQWLCANI